MAAQALACTNFIVGKKASADGSVMCSYSADSYGAFMKMAHYPAAKHAKGEMRKIFEWDTNKYLGEIPEAPETYSVLGNINEYQVASPRQPSADVRRWPTLRASWTTDHSSMSLSNAQRLRARPSR